MTINSTENLNLSTSSKEQESSNPSPKTFSCTRGVRKGKDKLLKERLQTLILTKGLTEPKFYNELGFSKQVWYAISWGIWDCTLETKLKIAKFLDVDTSVIWGSR